MGSRKNPQGNSEFSEFEVDVQWFVVFEEKDMFSKKRDDSWWRIFTKDGYRHVWAFTALDNGDYISINPTRGGIVLATWDKTFIEEQGCADFAEFCIKMGCTDVLPCVGKVGEAYIPRFLPLTCVSVVKHILGFKTWAFTPLQLYGRLVSNCLDMVKYKDILEYRRRYSDGRHSIKTKES